MKKSQQRLNWNKIDTQTDNDDGGFSNNLAVVKQQICKERRISCVFFTADKDQARICLFLEKGKICEADVRVYGLSNSNGFDFRL